MGMYENYVVNDNTYNNVTSTAWKAQTFTPLVTHTCKQIRVKIKADGPLTLTASIKATDVTGLPTGDDLDSGTLIYSGSTADYAWTTIILTAGVSLTAATKYALVLKTSANTINWREDTAVAGYARGNICYSADSGVTWGQLPAVEFLFEEWSYTPSVQAVVVG
jgi:hypothetical protein